MYTFAKTPAALFRHIQRHYMAMQPFREADKLLNDEYIGSNAGYPIRGKRPVNYVYETVEGLRTGLSPEQVRHTVISKQAQQAFDAIKIGLQLDADGKEMKLGDKVGEVALEAFFTPIAIARLGEQAGPRTVEVDGETLKKPTATLDLVMFEDLSLDTDAKSWEKRRFIADRVEVSRSAARETMVFGRDPAEYQQAMPNGQMPQGAPDDIPVMTRQEAADWFANAPSKTKEKSSVNQRQNQGRVAKDGMRDEDDDTVLLWHVEVRHGGCSYIAFIPDSDGQEEKFLLFERYRHHPDGPYEHLKFGDVRGNILGSAGLAAIYDLHDFGRKIGNKLISQIMKLKVVLAYSEGGNAPDDAMRVHKHADDGPVRVQDVSKLATLQWGGVPKEFYPALEWLSSNFGNIGGGVRQMSGTEEGGNTLGQEQMLTGKNEQRRERLKARVRGFMRRVAEKMAFQAIFNNPVGKQQVDLPLGQGMSVPVEVNPSEMNADAFSFQYDIEPYNYASADPTTQRQLILQFLTVLTGLLPLIQGGAIQAPWVEQLARHYFGIESTSQMLGNLAAMGQMAAQSMQQGQQPIPAGQPKPQAAALPPGRSQPQRKPAQIGQPARAGGGY